MIVYLKSHPIKAALLACFLLAGITAIGFEIRASLRRVKEIRQADEQVGSVRASANPVINDPRVIRLMSQYHLGRQAAEFLAKTKVQVVDQTSTSVHYLLTFADGVTSDETITLNPGQKYIPTATEIERAVRPGVQVIKPSLTAKQTGPKEMQFVLHYFLQESALPAEVLEKIHPAAPAVARDFFSLVPSAAAQEGGGGAGSGDNGGQFVAWNVVELTKSMNVKQLEQMEWEKSAKVVDNILTARDVINGYNEISGWLGEIAELEECAKHPTNPLTQKAANTDEYGHQVIGGLNALTRLRSPSQKRCSRRDERRI
jgi:hypothetical protein